VAGDSDNVEHYDGTTWTAATALPSSLQDNLAQVGTQTAGYVAGGKTSPSPSNLTTGTFEYDGTTWRAGASLANSKR
jgi:hypothetical protein